MKFPRIDLCCDADNTYRPVLTLVKVEKYYTYASDAHICIRHRTSEIFHETFYNVLPDEGIYIPKKAIKLLREKNTLNISLSDDKQWITLHRKDGAKITYSCENKTGSDYPKADSVFPSKKDCQPLDQIALNPDLLYKLSRGMETKTVHIRFYEPTKAILACPNNKNGDDSYWGVEGIIMPCMILP